MSIELIIADDAPFIREVIRELAEAEGLRVLAEAQDGVQAVKLALDLKPDVVIMDMVMPEKNGIEATQEILASWPEARILGVSTLHDDTFVVKALEAGCREYLKKPFEKEELLKALRSCAGQSLEEE